jgi:hypothetical protein
MQESEFTGSVKKVQEKAAQGEKSIGMPGSIYLSSRITALSAG